MYWNLGMHFENNMSENQKVHTITERIFIPAIDSSTCAVRVGEKMEGFEQVLNTGAMTV